MENNCRLIDASAVLKHFDGYGFGQECDAEIILDYIAEGAPTVDAVEVVRGHWKEYSHSALVRWKDGEPVWADRSVFRCSRCDFGTIARHNYCPRCGAKMDGGNEDG